MDFITEHSSEAEVLGVHSCCTGPLLYIGSTLVRVENTQHNDYDMAGLSISQPSLTNPLIENHSLSSLIQNDITKTEARSHELCNKSTLQLPTMSTSTMEEAIATLRAGNFLLVLDDENRENEGDLVMAARHATASKVAFAVRHTTGILCAPMSASRAAELGFRLMVPNEQCTDPHGTAFTVSTDAIGTGTGVSATDRANTLNCLADEAYGPEQFRRPGHIFPLIARSGGVLERRGHTEAAVDLCELADIRPSVGLIGELVNSDGSMKRLRDCTHFAKQHDIKMITVEQLADYRRNKLGHSIVPTVTNKSILPVTLLSQCILPIKLKNEDLGQWTLKCFASQGRQHICLILGNVSDSQLCPVLTRIHSQCFTGDTLGSQRCDCGEQLAKALELIAKEKRGIIIYVDGHEGRGIGLANKIKAYNIQEIDCIDTFAANRALNLPEDLRDYSPAKAILSALQIQKIRLMTNNRDKIHCLKSFVEDVIPLDIEPNQHNRGYLSAKQARQNMQMGNGKASTQVKNNTTNTQKNGESDADNSLIDKMDNEDEIKNDGQEHGRKTVHGKAMPNFGNQIIPAYLKIGIVRTQWNQGLVDSLANGVQNCLIQAGISPNSITDVRVPGSWEVPFAAARLAHDCHAVVCVGVLLKGETAHFDVLSHATANGLMRLQLDSSGVPIVNGILNCFTEEQAQARCDGDSGLAQSLANTALSMATLNKNGVSPKKPAE
ncbi:3,4-dihydroxy-2-butanone 4-phosphate synthase domain-containing protein [Ditylenchus destructor]|uniref:3,4-dihydroxy-2-butanone 4-phosphate synthase domain-containing protein n=1 Tax=Ditylenchus destructor TaxID=166010 RepID=A0AAD4RB74_9BILA|nr:3,4-dihydroxy-2-butanone 4-phosphate synthase domain-containing protein [Ditylenchus destructor]